MSDTPREAFGPLPKGDRADELEQLSFRAVEQAFPVDRFRFRDERGQDKGVDASLEILVEGGFTNLRSQLQLKSTDGAATNGDGSISIAVDTSNVNYLLNGQSPLYMLWIAPRGEIRFLWARDERRRLDERRPAWMEQKEVTLRFARVLDTAAVEEIYQRILREGCLHRRSLEILARSIGGGSTRLVVGTSDLSVQDPDQLRRTVFEQGMSLVAAGQGQRLLDLLQNLNDADQSAGQAHLIRGYALMTLGRYQAAAGSFAEARIRHAELGDNDKHFLQALVNVCDFHTGRIDCNTLEQRENELEGNAPTELALQYRFDRLRRSHSRERNVEQGNQLLEEMRELERETAGASASLRLQIRIALAYARGSQSIHHWLQEVTLAHMRQGMGIHAAQPAIREANQRLSEERDQWETLTESLVEDASSLGHPILRAEALLCRIGLRIGALLNTWFIAIVNGEPAPDFDVLQLRAWIGEAEEARQSFESANCLEGQVRATLAQADLHELTGNNDEAQELARGTIPISQAMGYTRHERCARSHLNGQTEWELLQAVASTAAEFDVDSHLAEATDEDIRRFAEACLQASRLPMHRLSVVQQDCFSLREIARQKRDWCMHLELTQDLSHTHHPSTHYAQAPRYACGCQRHGYRSGIEYQDWAVVISAFKRTRCEGCPDQEPRNSGAVQE